MGTKKSRGAKSPCVSIHADKHVAKFSYFLEHGNIFGQEHQYFTPLAHKSACNIYVIYTGLEYPKQVLYNLENKFTSDLSFKNILNIFGKLRSYPDTNFSLCNKNKQPSG